MVSSLPITLTFILVVLVSWVFSQTTKCFIECQGFALTQLTADPIDCHNYYICTSATTWNPYPLACPDGQNFDTVNKQCYPTNLAHCTLPCEKCSTSCSPGLINRAAYPDDCSRYYECDGNGGIVATHVCGLDAPYFDGFTCQTDQRNCCSCKAQCTQQEAVQHSMIADTANCTNYYICYDVGVADETYHGHCPTGNFDQVHQTCSNSADCSSYYCQNLYGCYEELICSETGYFPKCKRACDRHYFYCSPSQIGEPAELETCINSHVLNPLTMECVDPSECLLPSGNVMS